MNHIMDKVYENLYAKNMNAEDEVGKASVVLKKGPTKNAGANDNADRGFCDNGRRCT